jgi:hypothetical protein
VKGLKNCAASAGNSLGIRACFKPGGLANAALVYQRVGHVAKEFGNKTGVVVD